MLDEKTIKANLKSYFAQASKIIDAKKAEMHYNSKWLKKLGFLEIGKMADLFSLHEFSMRENIAKRLNAGRRVSLRELMYPIMQGYDSVAVKADVEIGGTDQRFNLLAGRVIQPSYKQKPQNILMTELMEGTDGRKMSSSWGNVINLTDEPNNMFGKVMSINDSLIEKYFVLATRKEVKEIEEIKKLANPRDQKLILAEEITKLYWGEKKAIEAKQAFINQFTKGELPEDIETKIVSIEISTVSEVALQVGFVASKGEARRLIQQGGIKLNGKTVTEDKIIISQTEQLLQVGKRKFVKVKSK
jgi:tyrosyl-tRNA synthetase